MRGSCSIESLERRQLFAVGGIDPYFGENGAAAVSAGTLVLSGNGEVYYIVRKTTSTGGSPQYSLDITRFKSNGSVDPSYHVTIATRPTLLFKESQSSTPGALDDTGRLFTTVNGRIYCLLPNGSLDKTFGAGGVVNTPFTELIDSLAIDQLNRLVVTGTQNIGAQDPGDRTDNIAAGVCVINPDGKRNTGFGPKGVRYVTDFVQDPDGFRSRRATGAFADSFGNLTVRVEDSFTNSDLFFLDERKSITFVRLNSDGVIDPTFGALEGQTRFSYSFFVRYPPEFSTDPGEPARITGTVLPGTYGVDTQGRLVTLLNDANANDPAHAMIMRRLPSGAIDASFDGDGFAELSFGAVHPDLDTFVWLPDGKYLITAHSGSGDSRQQYLIRLNSNGSFDSTFDGDGVMSLGTNLTIQSFRMQSDGSILSRESFKNGSGQTETVLRRRWANDAPVASLSFRHVLAATTRAQTLDVTYRDEGSIDLSTLSNRDLKVQDQFGSSAYAKFIGVIASTNNDGLVTARYRFTAPGGSWDSADNGLYSVRLIKNEVADTEGHFESGATVGTFLVRIRGGAVPAAFHPRPDVFSKGPSTLFNDRMLDEYLL